MFKILKRKRRSTWDVQAARGDVGAQQRARLRLAELEEGGRPLLLLLLAVDVLHRDVHVVEQLRVVLYGVAGGEEDHDLRRFAVRKKMGMRMCHAFMCLQAWSACRL